MYLRSILALLTLVFAGCAPRSFPGEGTVHYQDGTPVASAMIEFLPESGANVARGKTNEKGEFELSTLGKEGIRAGNYSVGIVQIVVMDGMQDHLRHTFKRSVPKKFNNPITSGIKISIPADGPLTIVVEDDTQP